MDAGKVCGESEDDRVQKVELWRGAVSVGRSVGIVRWIVGRSYRATKYEAERRVQERSWARKVA